MSSIFRSEPQPPSRAKHKTPNSNYREAEYSLCLCVSLSLSPPLSDPYLSRSNLPFPLPAFHSSETKNEEMRRPLGLGLGFFLPKPSPWNPPNAAAIEKRERSNEGETRRSDNVQRLQRRRRPRGGGGSCEEDPAVFHHALGPQPPPFHRIRRRPRFRSPHGSVIHPISYISVTKP